MRTSALFILRGAKAGGLVGALDACDTIARGWTMHLPVGSWLLVLLVMVALGASAGALIGAVCGAGASLVRSRHARSAEPYAQSVLWLGLGLATGGLVWGFRMLFPMPIAPVVAVGCAAGVVGMVLALRFRSRPAVVLALWLGAFAWCYAIVARLLYSFSRFGAATLVHAAWSVGICVLAIIVLSSPVIASKTGTPPKRPGVTALVALALAVALLGGARSLLQRTPHALRLVLYERTSLTYSLLAALPLRRLSVDDLGQGCEAVGSPPPRSEVSVMHPAARGVVLVIVDALRGDRVPSRHTPNTTRLGEEGLRFRRAYTTAPVTRLAAESMMSGMGLRRHGRSEPILAGALADGGVRSIALSDHGYLDQWVQGFDVHEMLTPPGTSANRESLGSERAFERARHHLEQSATGRFFLLVHFYDPHAHYVPNDMFPAGASLSERYDAEVAYADHHIGRLLDFMRSEGLERDVAVIVLGDHGDEHWEHRYRWHRARVYDESVRVPIVLRAAGGAGGAVVESPVSVMDVAPTVLDLFGLPIPAGLDGISLLRIAASANSFRERALLMSSDLYPTFALVQGDHKLIANLHTGILEFYDLARDPAEQRNLADEPTAPYHAMRCRLAERLRDEPPLGGASR